MNRAHSAPRAVLAASLWMAGTGNVPLWRELHDLGLLASWQGWVFGMALAGVVATTLIAIAALFAWRWTLKPVLVLLLVATAVTAYFEWTYRVVVDPGMATNVLQTDAREAGALFDPRFALALLVLAGLPAWLLLRTPIAHPPAARQLLRNLALAAGALASAVVLIALAFQPLASAMRGHKQLRYLLTPLNAIYAFGDVAAAPLRGARLPLQPLGRDARLASAAGARPPLVVLVLGETTRSGNFGLNGYERDTTPELARSGVVSWRNAWSCGTSTAASVPCMFSHLGREGYARRAGDSETLLDVLQHAGLAVLWVDNQSGCKGVCDRVPFASTAAAKDPRFCRDGTCDDEVLLEGLEQRLAALPAERRARGVVLVLHPMGSHGPAYHERSPARFKRFLPECTSVQLQDCPPQAIVNAYDNSIAYTDHVLARTIDWLRTREATHDTALVFVGDHGESLGEHNLYLHGLPWSLAPDVQKRVPWITWLSPGFQRRTGVDSDCLRTLADRPVSHDHYFHAVLGLLQVATTAYRRELDPYQPCVAP